ncbi:MAG: deoxyribose-phosphate aldolase [Nitrospirota bacterium]
MIYDATDLAIRIDQTLVRPDATVEELTSACEAARQYGFSCVVVSSSMVAQARRLLDGTLIKVCCVVGFPHGTNTTTVKIFEAMEAIKNGASELDICIHIGLVKSGRLDAAEIDIKNIIALTPQKVHKIILETGSLTQEEIVQSSHCALRAGAEFIKTSTGYGPRGATVDDIRLIRDSVGSACRIKASGGIKDLAAVMAMIEAGADRVGTSSGPAIMQEYLGNNR